MTTSAIAGCGATACAEGPGESVSVEEGDVAELWAAASTSEACQPSNIIALSSETKIDRSTKRGVRLRVLSGRLDMVVIVSPLPLYCSTIQVFINGTFASRGRNFLAAVG